MWQILLGILLLCSTANAALVVNPVTGRLDSTGTTFTNITESGSNVGINTVSPGATLEVNGGLLVDGTVTSTGTISGTGFATTGSGAGLMAAASGFSIDPANSTYTTGSVFINTVGNIGIGSTVPEARLKIVGSGTGTVHAIDIVDSAKTSRFIVTDSGLVGIGTNNPASTLCVGTTCQFSVTGSGGVTAGNGVTSSSLTGSATSTSITMAIKQTAANAVSGGIQFQTGNNGNIKPMTILTGGNIGIMTTSPADSLEIDGNIYVRGTGFKYKAQSPDGTWWQCQPANTTGVFTCS